MNDDRLVENLAVAGPAAPPRRALLRPAAAAALSAAARRLPAALAAAAPAATFAQPKGPAAPPLRVGFVYVSPVAGVGWTPQQDAARRELEQALAGRATTTWVENVPEGPDAERVIRDLVSRGHGLVFATSFGYMEPMLRVAREFPEVAFEHLSGWKTTPNLAVYNARFYEGRWLAGMVAGRATAANAIGYVAGFPIPEVLQGINAFTLGARATNPKAEVRVVWTSAWFDPGRERDAAIALMGQGAEVLTNHSDSPAVPIAAQARGRWCVGYHSDMSSHAPSAQLTAVTHHWGDFYTASARAVLEGRWRNAALWGGLREGMVRLAPFGAVVPAGVRQQVAARQADIVAGRAHPFGGRLIDNEGRERQSSGMPSDETLAGMNWFVQGVQGKPPGA